jgi:7-keto-8-aminopelargonate synthetase-like enzyme
MRIIRREPERIERLWKNTELMREGLKSLGFDTGLSETPIIPVHVGNMMDLGMMCKGLEEEGVFVNPVIPPAVPPNECLIRISVMATHRSSHIEFALEKLDKIGKKLNVL